MPTSIFDRIVIYITTTIVTCYSIILWKTYNCIFSTLASGIDFNHYYATAWLVINNIMPYGVRFDSTTIADQFVWHDKIPSATNPPLLALTTSFIAIFDKNTAWTLWTLMIISSIAVIYYIIRHELAYKWPVHQQLFLVIIFLSHSSVIENIYLSQIQSILLMYVLFGWSLLRHNDSYLGGLCWGISVAVKYYTLPLLLLLLVTKRTKAFVSATIISGALSCIPLILLNKNIYEQFLSKGANIILRWSVESPYNISLFGCLHALSVISKLYISTNVLMVCVNILAIILLCYGAYLTGKAGKTTYMFDWGTALFLIISLAGTLVSWPSYYIFVLFVVSLIIEYNFESFKTYSVLVLLILFTGNIWGNALLMENFGVNFIRIIMPLANLGSLLFMLLLCFSKLRLSHGSTNKITYRKDHLI